MRRLGLLAFLLALSAPSAYANSSARGWCEAGNQPVITSGLTSTTTVQGSYSQCTVTVLIHGAGAATIYSDNSNTPLANPFLANTNGQWTFFAINGRYDITLTCVSPCVPPSPSPFPVTYSDVVISDTATGQFKGPIPWVDVMTYGARPLATNLGTLAQTGTINSGSASLTLSAIGQYQNGDNIVVVGAGIGNSAGTSAPSAPTVTPSVATGPLNTGETAASATGSTTYSYEMMWCDLATMACTPPSTATTITNGQATLGLTTVSITSIARSGTAATITAAAAHQLPLLGSCSSTACPEVQVWKGSDASFTGFSRIVSTADNTHLVYTTPSSTTFGATSSSTGGQFEYFLGNHIACGSAPTATSICVIYGRAVGSFTFIGAGIMGNTYWDDWGTTISGNPLRPAWIPNTPPATFQNNSLNTTISSGAGTTSVVLAASASTSVTSQYTTIDECPNLKSAVTASLTGGAQVYIPPPNGTGSFVIGSYCALAANAQIRQAGPLWLTSPIALTGLNNNWIANHNSATSAAVINVSNTAPGIYLSSSLTSSTFDGWNVQSQNANNAVLILSDMATNNIVKNYNFQAGNGSGVSYLGMSEVVRGNGFDNIWDYGTMIGDYPNGGSHLGDTTAPSLLFAMTGGGVGAYIRNGLDWTAKTIAETGNFNFDLVMQNMHFQGPIMPSYTTDSTNSNGGGIIFEHISNDSTAAPIFAPLTGYNGVVKMYYVSRSGDTNGAPPVVSGNNVSDLEIMGVTSPIGQNFNVKIAAASGTPENGENAYPYAYNSYIVPGGNPSVIAYENLVTATSAVVSSGGSVPTVQECYSVAPVYTSGLVGLPGNSVCATPTSGNQTVTVSWTNLTTIPGVKYNVYRSDGGGRPASSENLTGSPYVDTFASGYGDSTPSFSADGYPHLGSNGLITPLVTAGTINCTIVNAVRCVSPSNPQGWSGSDAGAQLVSAISNCAGPCEIQIAAGTYTGVSLATITTNVHIRGAGNDTTIWQTSSATADMIDLNSGSDGSVIEGIKFDASVTRTGGVAVNIKSNRVEVRFNHFTNQYDDVQVNGSAFHSNIHNNIAQNSLHSFALYNTTAGGDQDLWDNKADNSPVSTGNGIWITNASGVWIIGNDILHFSDGLFIGPSSGVTVKNIFCVASAFDSNTNNAIELQPPSNGNINNFDAEGCWAAGSTNYGISLDNSGGANRIDGFNWNGGWIRANGLAGLFDQGGTGSAINVKVGGGAEVSGNSVTSSGTRSGLEFGAGVTNFYVNHVRAGPVGGDANTQNFGILVNAGSSNNYEISNSDLSGNVNGGLSDSGTGAAKVITGILPATAESSPATSLNIAGVIKNFAATATMGLPFKKGSGAGNYTNATTTYAVADSANLCLTVTIPTGWKLAVVASGGLGTSTAVVEADVALTDNAACSTANAGLLTEAPVFANAAGNTEPFSLDWVITGDGASHNIAMQFKTTNAADTANLLNSSSTRLPTMNFTLMPSN